MKPEIQPTTQSETQNAAPVTVPHDTLAHDTLAHDTVAPDPGAHDSNGPGRSPISLPARPLLLFLMVIVLMGGSFVAGLGMGFGAGRWSLGDSIFGRSAVAAIPECFDEEGTGYAELAPYLPVFREAINLLYRDFYGELPEADEAVYSAIRGLLNTLDDPNTSFMAPVDADFFRTNLVGSFEGIGARVGWNDAEDTLIITEPFENQPAWNAGIRRDDLILAVDGESLIGSSISEAVQRIRGPKGSTVVLTVKRAILQQDSSNNTQGANPEGTIVDYEVFDVSVVRDQIDIPTISTDRLGENGEIAYIRLNSFNENAGQLVHQAVTEAVREGSQAMIFDLRGNSGGLLREAVRVASVFLQNEVVLLERFSDGRMETYRTSGRAAINNMPLVVLVNGGSASASEIVAGAIQDAGRAPLLGSVTYGKGSVQLPHTLSDGSIMRVTVAQWYTPLDRTIDGIGLQPDILVEREPAQAAPDTESGTNGDTGAEPDPDGQPASTDRPSTQSTDDDIELEAAIRYLLEQLQAAD